jgi:hypothetical protein
MSLQKLADWCVEGKASDPQEVEGYSLLGEPVYGLEDRGAWTPDRDDPETGATLP